MVVVVEVGRGGGGCALPYLHTCARGGWTDLKKYPKEKEKHIRETNFNQNEVVSLHVCMQACFCMPILSCKGNAVQI